MTIALMGIIQGLRETLGDASTQNAGTSAPAAYTLSREDLRLICFEFIS